MNFCEMTGSIPIPADVNQICRYVVYLSDTLKYVSIINYLSAVTQLHKLYGYDVHFSTNYLIKFTLAGLRRVLGDPQPNRPTLHVQDLLAMYRRVNLTDIEERAMWACIVLGFRSLLRKSNMLWSHTSDSHVIRREAIQFFPWGMLITISSTKTIQYGQRKVTIPITASPGSPLCAVYWVRQHLLDVPTSSSDIPLFQVPKGKSYTPLTYNKVLSFLKSLLRRTGRDPDNVGLHSLRRAGASYMHSIGLTLEDIRQVGDWQSLAALIYLAHPLQGRIETDRRVSSSLQALAHYV